MDTLDSIYHERQEGQLCAQHCLNNLLQGPYFDAVQLAEIAQKFDEEEKRQLASREGISTLELKKIFEQPSTNMDDSGFFSVQVITEALKLWSVELNPLSSPQMKHAVDNPIDQMAFICNHELHWFTIRKLGCQWFNLDSLKKSPLFITDTYLSLFLAQLQLEGYSIFVLIGSLPTCEADELLSLIPYQTHGGGKTQQQRDCSSSASENEDEQMLAEAIALSLSGSPQDRDTPNEELRQKRLKHFQSLH